jgi:hypothetical protein
VTKFCRFKNSTTLWLGRKFFSRLCHGKLLEHSHLLVRFYTQLVVIITFEIVQCDERMRVTWLKCIQAFQRLPSTGGQSQIATTITWPIWQRSVGKYPYIQKNKLSTFNIAKGLFTLAILSNKSIRSKLMIELC